MGIWPPNADGTDVNAVDRSKSGLYLATSDDEGMVKLFNYPCVIHDAPHRAYRWRGQAGGRPALMASFKGEGNGKWEWRGRLKLEDMWGDLHAASRHPLLSLPLHHYICHYLPLHHYLCCYRPPHPPAPHTLLGGC